MTARFLLAPSGQDRVGEGVGYADTHQVQQDLDPLPPAPTRPMAEPVIREMTSRRGTFEASDLVESALYTPKTSPAEHPWYAERESYGNSWQWRQRAS